MNSRVLVLSVIGTIAAGAAQSAPVDAFSNVSYNHNFIINSGSLPDGMDFSLAAVLERSRDADTRIDEAGTNITDVPTIQVGVVADPPVPYIDRRGINETSADDTDAARARYDTNILQTNGDDTSPTLRIVTRDVDNQGGASFVSTDGAVSGGATSDFFLSRVYEYTNNSNSVISFNLAGEFSADLLARYEGDNGIARTTLNYLLSVGATDGVDVTYLPTQAYGRTVTELGANAFTSESLVTGPDGFSFSASTSAFGDGGATVAEIEDAYFRYILLFTLAPGSSFTLTDRFTQTNFVEYDGMPIIPLPASGWLLLCSFGGFAALRRRKRQRSLA